MRRQFLSVVVAVQNIRDHGLAPLLALQGLLLELVEDFELILVDNGSTDGTTQWLRELLGNGELVNTVVFALSQEAQVDAALWTGVERAIGDAVITIPSGEDSPEVIKEFMANSAEETDLVIGANRFSSYGSKAYWLSKNLLARLSGDKSSLSRCLMMSRRLVNYLQLHGQPHVNFRQLARVPGLKALVVDYESMPMYPVSGYTFRSKYTSGLRFLFWRNPSVLRVASLLSLSGAALNIIYAFYVLFVFLFTEGAEPGWASLSLQFSGMFFLMSVTLFVLSENLLLAVSLSAKDPAAFITEEFVSKVMGVDDSLNLRTQIRNQRLGREPSE